MLACSRSLTGTKGSSDGIDHWLIRSRPAVSLSDDTVARNRRTWHNDTGVLGRGHTAIAQPGPPSSLTAHLGDMICASTHIMGSSTAGITIGPVVQPSINFGTLDA